MRNVVIALLLALSLGLLACNAPPGKSTAGGEDPPTTPTTPGPMVDAGDVGSRFPETIAPDLAARFARLALDCVHREYPNKVSRTMDSDAEVGPPRELFPAFYGCFDWHSAVHGHWLLVRLLRVGAPEAAWREEAVAKLDQSFTVTKIAGELAQFERPARGSWERPYGLAWFLQLCAELREWDDPHAARWLDALRPLETAIAASLEAWLPKLAYPIRLGTHNQSAFAFGLMLDWARTAGATEMEARIGERARTFHLEDRDCPLAYEPSGEDFLSPCLMEADLMRRVLAGPAFADWLTMFLPQIPTDGTASWLAPGIVLDATDGKLVHLDGVNSSRAWNLYNIVRALPADDPRIASLVAAATVHQEAGVAAVSDEHYAGSHWLASFATYLKTDRGFHATQSFHATQ